jgi:ribosomal protein S18 acetylase RimI-like enzyme
MNETVHITGNLFTFYKEVARLGQLGRGTIGGIPWVGSPSGGWPGYLLGEGAPDTSQVKEIAAAMTAGKVPALWILESVLENETEKRMSAHGIRMINYWTGMYLNVADRQAHMQTDQEYEIRKITRESQMDRWVGLVNRVIMTSSNLDPALFRKLLYSEKFHFYGLWYDDELLSATLIFVHDLTAGLYFIATDEVHQGKGYGTAIVDYAMHDIQAAGAERFILHATRQGLKLYQKKGYRAVNRYDIYWLLGKR